MVQRKSVEGYINSFPKSGRTWVRYTLAQYFKNALNIDEEIGFKTLGSVFNDLGAKHSRTAEYEAFPNIIFSHLHPQKQQAHANNIMIVRNALDVMVSYFHHHDAIRNMKCSVYDGLMKYDLFTHEYGDYMNAWFNDQRTKVEIIYYEKLHDPLEWFDIIERLGHIGDLDQIHEAMMASNFENMQQDELANPQVMKNWSSEPNHMRVRKGKIGGWKDELRPHQASAVMSKIKHRLKTEATHVLNNLGVLPEV